MLSLKHLGKFTGNLNLAVPVLVSTPELDIWNILLFLQLFHDGGLYHIEASPLICRANHWTGFYMMGISVMKELVHFTIYWTSSLRLTLLYWQFYGQFRKIRRKTPVSESLILIKVQAPGLQLYYKRDPDTGVFLWILRNFSEQLFYRTPPGDCFFLQMIAHSNH